MPACGRFAPDVDVMVIEKVQQVCAVFNVT